jgi:hypothetical protein
MGIGALPPGWKGAGFPGVVALNSCRKTAGGSSADRADLSSGLPEIEFRSLEIRVR